MLSFLGDRWLYAYIVISSVLSNIHVLNFLNCDDFFQHYLHEGDVCFLLLY